MSLFQDLFTQPQVAPSTIGAPVPGVTPNNFSREAIALAGATTTISPGWNYTLPPTSVSEINYDLSGGSPLNLTTQPFIYLMGATQPPSGTFLYRMNAAGTLAAGVSDGLGNVVFDLSGAPGLANIAAFDIAITNLTGVAVTGSVASINSAVTCVAKDTLINMADGTKKEIQYIQRGDIVSGDLEGNVTYKVSRVIRNKFNNIEKIDIAAINTDALGENKPDKKLLLSGWHPILWNGMRKPAKCFRNIPGCEWYNFEIKASEILPADDETLEPNQRTFSLYNLQFDTEGFFVANGLILQSLSPHSKYVPLPKELYFDANLADKPLVSESYHTETIWDKNLIEI